MKSKKLISITTLAVALMISCIPVFAAEKDNANVVISTLENVNVPDNVSIVKETFDDSITYNASNEIQTMAVSVTYNTDSGILWSNNGTKRAVWGSCQAKQGTVKLDSYSRARFEKFGGLIIYCDSGRVWSTNQGKSYAKSGWENYDQWDSGVAHTYYGIGVN